MTSTARAERAFLGVSALLFAASTAITIVWCAFAPAGPRLARATGVLSVGAGLFLIARAAGLG